jgi:D-alanyl-D-alanine carboxypeptidase
MRGWIAGLMLFAVALAPQAGWAKAVPARSTLARAVEAYAARTGFSGTVVVRRGGAVIYQRAFGMADRAFAVPAAADTRYWIASITKQFTSTMVLQLAEEGKLSLKGRVGDYLPDFRGKPAGEVTMESLLGHVSGLPQMDTAKSYEEAVKGGLPAYQLPHSSDDMIRLYASGDPVRPMGKAFDYNNADYLLLGKLVEVAGGEPYEAALRHRILARAGLKDTGLLLQSRILPRLAHDYFRPAPDQPWVNDLPVYPENWWAAGGLYSTAPDVARFGEALYGGRLLKPESLKRMLTPIIDDYGCGVWVRTLKAGGREHPTAERYGSIMGANAILFRILDDDLTIAVLGNSNAADMGEFAVVISRAVLGPK